MMEKEGTFISMALSLAGGFFAWLIGGWDTLVQTILVLVVLDYVSGIIKAVFAKRVSSEIGFRGIGKKILIFLIISAATLVQAAMGGGIPLRETVILFFIANEAISICENAAQMGLPIPKKLKNVLLQLKKEGDSE